VIVMGCSFDVGGRGWRRQKFLGFHALDSVFACADLLSGFSSLLAPAPTATARTGRAGRKRVRTK